MEYYEYTLDLFETEQCITYDVNHKVLHVGTILGQGTSQCPFIVANGIDYNGYPLPMCFYSYIGNGLWDDEPCSFYKGIKVPHGIGKGLIVKCSLEDNRVL